MAVFGCAPGFAVVSILEIVMIGLSSNANKFPLVHKLLGITMVLVAHLALATQPNPPMSSLQFLSFAILYPALKNHTNTRIITNPQHHEASQDSPFWLSHLRLEHQCLFESYVQE